MSTEKLTDRAKLTSGAAASAAVEETTESEEAAQARHKAELRYYMRDFFTEAEIYEMETMTAEEKKAETFPLNAYGFQHMLDRSDRASESVFCLFQCY
jgi:hypothetical protein